MRQKVLLMLLEDRKSAVVSCLLSVSPSVYVRVFCVPTLHRSANIDNHFKLKHLEQADFIFIFDFI
ncbi:hypothetical protein NQZ68_038064 [Dissostichus eleginoides]|nr:hypothetical protein NQZ68_038064 [Dissostichus eleginoides]